MILSTLGDVVYEFYERGRPSATGKTFDKEDISMMLRQGLSSKVIRNYYDSKKLNEGDEYYITSALLSVQRFDVGNPDSRGMRRVDMSLFDVYRLPKNAHIINAYPVGCAGSKGKSMSMVQPGEEVFYQKPKFNEFEFGVPIGRGIDAWHLPPCVKFLDVQSTFDFNDIDVPLDVAYDISREVLGVMAGIPFQAGKNPNNPYAEIHQLKQRLSQAEAANG